MRLPRSTKEYGGGSGKEIYESDLFRVVIWSLNGGIKTTIEMKLSNDEEIDFDGEYGFVSDNDCLDQLDSLEILSMINYQKEQSFMDGGKSKVKEFKKLLEIF